MPTYEIVKRDGTPVRVEGPEGATTKQLIDILKRGKSPTPVKDTTDQRAAISQRLAQLAPGSFGQGAKELGKGILGGAAGILETGALGAADFLTPDPLDDVVRDAIKVPFGGIQDALAPAANVGVGASKIPRKFGEALGSFGGILGAAAVNPLAGAGLAVTAGMGEATERAREAGASPEQRGFASLFGAGIGASELIAPTRILSTFRKGLGDKAANELFARGRRIATEGTVEGLQEFAATVGQNLVEQGIYNPQQGTFEGSGEALGYGAGVGGFVQAVVEMVTPRTRGRATAAPTTPTTPDITDQIQALDQEKPLALPAPRPDIGSQLYPDSPTSATNLQIAPTKAITDQTPAARAREKIAEQTTTQTRRKSELEPQAAIVDPIKKLEGPRKQLPAPPNIVVEPGPEGRAIPITGKTQEQADLEGAVSVAAVQRADQEAREAAAVSYDTPSLEVIQGRQRLVANMRRKVVEDATIKNKEQLLSTFDQLYANPIGAKGVVPEDIFNEVITAVKRETQDKATKAQIDTLFKNVNVDDLYRKTDADVQAEYVQSLEPAAASVVEPAAASVETEAALVETEVAPVRRGAKAKVEPVVAPVRRGAKATTQDVEEDTTTFQKEVKKQILKRKTDSPTVNLERFYKANPDLVERYEDKGLYMLDTGETTRQTQERKQRQRKKLSRLRAFKVKFDKEEGRIRNNPDIKKRLENKLEEIFDVSSPDALKAANSKFYEKEDKTSRLRTDDATNNFDKGKVINLVNEQNIQYTKEGTLVGTGNVFSPKKAAALYFGKYKRPIDALRAMVHDKEFGLGSYTATKDTTDVQDALYIGTGKVRATAALKWVKANLGESANQFVVRQELDQSREAEIDLTEQKTREEIDAEDRAKLKKKTEADKRFEEDLRKGTTEDFTRELREYTRSDRAVNRGNISLKGGLKAKDYNLTTDAVVLDIPMHPVVKASLMDGDLRGALAGLQTTSPNAAIQKLAGTLLNNVGSTKLQIVNKLGKGRAGIFSPTTNTIKLDSVEGINVHTLLHEMTHATVSAEIKDNSQSSPVVSLKKIFNQAVDRLDTVYGTQNIDEFMSEAMSNPQFQEKLSKIITKDSSLTLLQRFRRAIGNILRRITGRPLVSLNSDALTEVNSIFEQLVAPAPKYRNAGDLELLTTSKKKVNELANGIVKGYYDFGNTARGKPLSGFLDAVGGLFNSIGNEGAKFVGFKVLPSQGLADVASYFGLENVQRIHEAFEKQQGAVNQAEKPLDGTLTNLRNWKIANPTLAKTFDDVVYKSTTRRVDPSLDKETYMNKDGSSKTDKDGNADLLDTWVAFNAENGDWTKLGKSGQAQYTAMRDTYKELYKQLQESIFTKIASPDLNLSEKDKDFLRNDVLSNLFKKELIEPYFPLTREGDYWLTYETNAGEYVVQAFETPGAARRTRRDVLATGKVKEETIAEFTKFETMTFDKTPSKGWVGQTIKVLQDNNVETSVQNEIMQMFVRALPESSFAKSMQSRGDKAGYIENSELAFQTKAYNLSRQIQQMRSSDLLRDELRNLAEQVELKNKGDENQPSADNLLTLRRDANASGDKTKIDAINKKIADYEKKYGKLLGSRDAKILLDEIETRVNFAINPPNNVYERVAQNANRIAFLGTIGFNVSSTVVNTVQIPTVVYPALAAKIGFKRAGTNLKIAGKLFTGAGFDHRIPAYGTDESVRTGSRFGINKFGIKTGYTKAITAPSIDNYFIADVEGNLTLRDDMNIDDKDVYYVNAKDKKFTQKQFLEMMQPFVQEVSNRGLLNRSLIFDTLGSEISGKAQGSMVSRLYDRLTTYSALPFHTTERMNRQVTLVASYLTEMDRLATNPNPNTNEKDLTDGQIATQAINTAMYDTQQTNGGATLTTATRIAQQNIARVAMMYKTFGVQMYYTQAKTFLKMIGMEKDPYLRKQATKQFWATQGFVMALAGVQGLTMYGIIAGLYNLFVDDDEETFETLTRKAIGEGFFKGGVNATTGLLGAEVDVAARIGLSNLILGSNRYNFDPSVEKSIVQAFGGVAWSYGSQIARGVGDISEGEYQRGIENILPAAFRNPAKVVRFVQEEGIRTRRGDLIFDDMNFGLYAAQALGFAPADYTLKQEMSQDTKKIDKAVNATRSKLLKQYYLARRTGDMDGVYEVADKMDEFNKKHPDAKITKETIDRSMKTHMQTSKDMVDGVTVSPLMRRALEQSRSEYDQGFTFF